MTEFIGARISLISKSNIRYVGILHEINSETSTVALEQVVSHGTEGRRGDPSQEIAGSDNVYEYIVFRGSDVKDLRIEEAAQPKQLPPPPQLDDPAILGQISTRPRPGVPQFPQQPAGQFHHLPTMASAYMFPHPPAIQQRFGPSPYQTPGMYGAYPPSSGSQPGISLPNPAIQQTQHHSNQHNQPLPQQNQSSLIQLPQAVQPSNLPATPALHSVNRQLPRQTPGTGVRTFSVDEQLVQSPETTSTSMQQNTVQSLSEQPKSDSKTNADEQARQNHPKFPTISKGRGQIVPALPLTSSINAAHSEQISKTPTEPQHTQSDEKTAGEPSKNSHDIAGKVHQTNVKTRVSNSIQPNSNTSSNGYAPAGRPRQSGPTYSTARGERGGYRSGINHSRKVEVPTTDYDFDAANAKLNKSDLVKEVIASGDTDAMAVFVNAASGPQHSEKGDSESEGSLVVPPVPIGGFYNRGSSFFDNISCENKERAEAKAGERRGGSRFRNEEQKKNLETFGQGSVDGGYGGAYRGGWRGGRGRGRGFGRSRGCAGYRGGFHTQQQQPFRPNKIINASVQSITPLE